jgi:hypothetical protein
MSNWVERLFGPSLDPEIARKLHEYRQKINIYYDAFETEQCKNAMKDLESEGRDE